MINLAYGSNVAKLNRIKILKGIVLSLLLFAVFYVSAKANLMGVFFAPFGISFLFAILWCNKVNVYLLFGLFLGANSLAGFSLESVYISIVTCGVGLIIYFIYKKLNRNIHIPVLYIAVILSQILLVYYNATSPKQTATILIFVAMSLVFLYCLLCFFKGTIIRGFNNRLNLDEEICGGVILVVLGMGLTSLTFCGFEVVKFVVALLILMSLKVFNKTTTIMIGTLMGVGYAVMFTNPTYIASFTLYAILAVAFNSNIKIFSALSVVLAEILFGFYFKTYEFFEWQSILSVAIPSLIYICLPRVVFEKISNVLGGYKNKIAVRSVVNRSKEQLCVRTKHLASIFADMNRVFRSTVKGNLPEKDAKEMLVNECIEKVCSRCGECGKCLKLNRESTLSILNNMVNIGFDRGRVTLLDVPDYLSNKCVKLNYLISTLNQLFSNFKNYSNMVNNMDSSKVLVADQLSGVSYLLNNLSKEINENISFDFDCENKIMEDLTYKNVNCEEVIVYNKGVSDKNITLIIDNKTYIEKIIERCVSGACGVKMKIDKVQASTYPNMSEVFLSVKPKFDLVFGASTKCKDGNRYNGDSHSLINLTNGKYMVAICDGMGTGKKAHLESSQTINLIEDFYKVGFDNETILNSVNRLLSLAQNEMFSTLDMCVLDVKNSCVDFIKLGSPDCYIKRKNGIEKVEGSALPIGVLEEMKPHIITKSISDNDIIVLVSDGVSDIFEGKSDLQTFINNDETINPQILSDDILNKALELNGGIMNDDLTVMCVRIFPNV